MTWVTPSAIDLRLGFEITSYVANPLSHPPPALSPGCSFLMPLGIHAGAVAASLTPPLWLLAELTYTCPLHCPFCSRGVDARTGRGARPRSPADRAGGGPLTRRDLDERSGSGAA